MHLDEKFNFNTHIKEKIAKANKGIEMICKLARVLPRESLITIYKSFVRPHIDYGDIIYDQPNDSFCNMVERVQYNAALAITGVIKEMSQLKIYKELGFQSLKYRRWFRHLCFFYKLRSTQTPKYLYNFFPSGKYIYIYIYIRLVIRMKLKHYCRTELFKYSFHIL